MSYNHFYQANSVKNRRLCLFDVKTLTDYSPHCKDYIPHNRYCCPFCKYVISMTMEKKFTKRLEILMGQLTPNAFAKTCSVDPKTIRKAMKGEIPGVNILRKITNNREATIGWLLGETETSDYCQIKLYDIHGSAGHGAYIENEEVVDVISFRETWIRNKLSCDPKQLTMIFVTGDSMEPTLSSGDVVLVNHAAATEKITDGIWVLDIGQGAIVKRLYVEIGDVLHIYSDNEIYKSQQVTLNPLPDNMRIIGRVVWYGKRT